MVDENTIVLDLGVEHLLVPSAHISDFSSGDYTTLKFELYGTSLLIDLMGVDLVETHLGYFVFGASVMNKFEINLLKTVNVNEKPAYTISFSPL